MIWAAVSSQSCFCWLYRASPSLTAKNITNLILVLTIWCCPYVESSLGCWKRVFAMTSVFSWQNSISLCPASFCTLRSNLPITPGISWLLTFVFQSPMMKRRSHLYVCVSSRRSCRSSQSHSTSASSGLSGWDIDLDYCDIKWFALEMNRDHSVILRLHPRTAFQTLLLTVRATPFLLGDSCWQ